MGKRWSWAIVAAASAVAKAAAELKISAVDLLLPVERAESSNGAGSIAVTAKLHAEPDCFEWFVSDPSVVSFENVQDDACEDADSKTIIVSVETNQTASCTVTARQDHTDLTVRVHTAPINRLRIRTKSRVVTLGAKSEISVEALDRAGNVFSSLEGLGFTWNAVPLSHDIHESPLVIKKISESELIPKDGLQQEKFGRYANEIEVFGQRTGRVRIQVELNVPRTQTNGSPVRTEVVMEVREELHQCPQSPVLLSRSSLALSAYRKVNSRALELVKDMSKYEWISTGENLNVDPLTGMLSTVKGGSDIVTFRQKDFPSNAVNSTIRIVGLDQLTLQTTPFVLKDQASPSSRCIWSSQHPQDLRLPSSKKWRGMDKDWIFMVGRRYFVMVSLVSQSLAAHEHIFVTESMSFSTTLLPPSPVESATAVAEKEGQLQLVDSKDLHLLPNVFIFEAKEVGFVNIEASFSHDVQPATVLKERVRVTAPVQAFPKIIRLPLDPDGKIFHTYQLKARGGTDHYAFQTVPVSPADDAGSCNAGPTNPLVTIDHEDGTIRIHQQSVLSQKVIAKDYNDAENFDTAEVFFSKVATISIASNSARVSVGDIVEFTVVLTDKAGHKFSNCSAFGSELIWPVLDGFPTRGNAKNLHRGEPSICATRKFKADSPGRYIVSVALGTLRSAPVSILVVPQIHVVYPIPNRQLEESGLPVALLPVHTSGPVIVSGGKQEDTFEVNSIGAGRHPTISTLKRANEGMRYYSVSCLESGTFEVTVDGRAKFVVICSPATTAKLIPVLTKSQWENLPEESCDFSSLKYFVNGQPFSFRLDLLDGDSRNFTEFEPIGLSWSLNPASRADNDVTFAHGVNPRFRTFSASKSFKGDVTISATIKLGGTTLNAELPIVVANDIGFEHAGPVRIVADSSVETSLNIINGAEELSDKIRCRLDNEDIAALVLSKRLASIHFRLATGQERSELVTCKMLCLVGSQPVQLPVHFARVAKLKMKVDSKVRQGSNFTVAIQAFDPSGTPFGSDMHKFIAPKLTISPAQMAHLEVPFKATCSKSSKATTLNQCAGLWSGTLAAVQPGTAVLHVDSSIGAVHTEHSVLIYRGLEFVGGASKVVEPNVQFRLIRVYGPFPDPTFCKLAVVKGADILELKNERGGKFVAKSLGQATVEATCTENNQIIDKAQINIQVKYVEGMTVIPNTLSSYQGEAVRVRVDFPEITEFPPDFDIIHREFEWKVSNESVASIEGSASDNGSLSVWIRSLSPGQAKVVVRSWPQGGSGKSLLAEANIHVARKLELTGPKHIMLTRGSTFSITTTVDDIAKPRGELLFVVSSVNCKLTSQPIRVFENGVVQAGEALGSGSIIIEYRTVFEGEEMIQRESVLVSVEEAAFVAIQARQNVGVYPIGLSLPLYVGIYNIHGRLFDSPVAPNKLLVNVSNPDIAIAKLVNSEPTSPYFAVSVEGLQEGSTSLVLQLSSHFDATTRPDIVRLPIVTPSSAFRFDFAKAGITTDGVVVVAGEFLVLPLAKITAVLPSLEIVHCTASLGSFVLESPITVDAANGTASCVIQMPNSLPDQIGNFTVRLKLGSVELEPSTFPASVGFKAFFNNRQIVEDQVKWPVATKKQLDLSVVGGTSLEDIVADSSNPLAIGIDRVSSSKSRFVVKRFVNETCGVSSRISLSHKGTKQRVEFNLVLPCENEAHREQGIGSLFSMGFLPVIIGSIVTFVLLCLFCQPSYTGPASSVSKKNPSFQDMDNPIGLPKSAHDLGLGSPALRRTGPRTPY